MPIGFIGAAADFVADAVGAIGADIGAGLGIGAADAGLDAGIVGSGAGLVGADVGGDIAFGAGDLAAGAGAAAPEIIAGPAVAVGADTAGALGALQGPTLTGATLDTAAGDTLGALEGPTLTGATLDTVAPDTLGALQGPTLTGATLDSGSAAGGIAPAAAPGITTTAPGTTTGLSGLPTAAPGPSAAAFTPPTQAAASSLDLTSAGPGAGTALSPTDTAGLSAFQGNVPEGTAALGVDTGPGSDYAATLAQGEAGALPGQTATAADAQATVDQLTAEGALPGGAPTAENSFGAFGAGISNFLSPVTTPIGNAIDSAGNFLASPTGKVLGVGLAGAGLLKDVLGGQGNIKGENELATLAQQLGSEGTALIQPNATAAKAVAGQATNQAATLENYLNTGSLPPAVQAALDQATNNAIEDAKGAAAAKGMSADPNENTELASTIAQIRQNGIIQGGTLAASLYSQGVGLDQLASQIYTGLVGAGTSAAGAGVSAQESVVGTNTQLNTNLNNSIANLASALGGGSRVIVNGNTVAVPG